MIACRLNADCWERPAFAAGRLFEFAGTNFRKYPT